MNDPIFHALVVDDDDRLRDLLKRYLSRNDILVSVAYNAAEARELVRAIRFDIAILDVMMPGENGFSLARHIANDLPYDLPVLLLTAKSEIDDRIEGLETGADDYLSKPFEPKELLLRLNVILKRRNKAVSNVKKLRFGSLEFEPDRMILSDGTKEISMTAAEANLLKIFIDKPGVVLSREALAELTDQPMNDRTIDVQVTRLRKKIEPNPKMPRYLITMRGQGYVLRPDIVQEEGQAS